MKTRPFLPNLWSMEPKCPIVLVKNNWMPQYTYTGYDFLTFAQNIGIKPKLATKMINDLW
jgi:hypothetical protein